MALDGYTLSYLVDELNTALADAKVDKIYQMDNYSILINLRKDKQNHKLYVSVHPQTGRFHLTLNKFKNPETPPLFCMVLRKHLEGSRLVEIKQFNSERIIFFVFDTINELGDRAQKTIIGEFMGKHSNLVLVDSDSLRIFDSLHRFNFSENKYREILPGKTYVFPPSQDKFNINEIEIESFIDKIMTEHLEDEISKSIMQLISGLGLNTAKEICLQAGVSPEKKCEFLGQIDFKNLFNELVKFSKKPEASPTLVKNNQRYVDFTPFPFVAYDDFEKENFDSMSNLVGEFIGGKDLQNTLNQKSGDLRRVVEKHINKLEKKFYINESKIKDFEKGEKFRIYGDLITANLYQIQQGKEAKVINYYSESQEEIRIPMNENLTPNQNAQKFYKRYNKLKTGSIMAKEQLAIISEELEYLESILTSINNSDNLIILEEIRSELVEQNYIKKTVKAKRKQKKPELLLSSEDFEGFKIYIGKNNSQNDYITMKLARGNDIWFHIKDIPGSHVLIKNPNKLEVPKEVLERAAALAAQNSKAKNLPIANVEYTLKKYVKKPTGAKPGMVIYENAKSIIVRQ